ncbi:hypothetical protein FB451DRAFT_1376495 [Mycena latifolia]|nr:hypothetical protein FB451DRAFT_1376495 [Mycena latifolia]
MADARRTARHRAIIDFICNAEIDAEEGFLDSQGSLNSIELPLPEKHYSPPVLVPFDHRLLSLSINEPTLCPYRASVASPTTLLGRFDIKCARLAHTSPRRATLKLLFSLSTLVLSVGHLRWTLDCGCILLFCYGGNSKILALVLQCRWLPLDSVLGFDAALYCVREVYSGWSLLIFYRLTPHQSGSAIWISIPALHGFPSADFHLCASRESRRSPFFSNAHWGSGLNLRSQSTLPILMYARSVLAQFISVAHKTDLSMREFRWTYEGIRLEIPFAAGDILGMSERTGGVSTEGEGVDSERVGKGGKQDSRTWCAKMSGCAMCATRRENDEERGASLESDAGASRTGERTGGRAWDESAARVTPRTVECERREEENKHTFALHCRALLFLLGTRCKARPTAAPVQSRARHRRPPAAPARRGDSRAVRRWWRCAMTSGAAMGGRGRVSGRGMTADLGAPVLLDAEVVALAGGATLLVRLLLDVVLLGDDFALQRRVRWAEVDSRKTGASETCQPDRGTGGNPISSDLLPLLTVRGRHPLVNQRRECTTLSMLN